MRTLLMLLLSTTVFVCGCETDPIISIPSKPVPVVYAIIEDLDTIHQISITKSFGANHDPANEALIYDSLHFSDIDVRVEYLPNRWRAEWQTCEVYKLGGMIKDSGYFSYPYHEYYQFYLKLRGWKIRYIDSLKINVDIPGYQNIEGKIKVLDSITISTPKFSQQYIYLTPQSSLKFHWDHSEPGMEPHAWSEIDVSFEFIEVLETESKSRWINFQNTQYFLSPHEQYREMSITYEEFISRILQEVEVDDAVKESYFGRINMHMTGGDRFMVEYMKYLEGYSNYNYGGYSNIQNGFGLISSATHFFKYSLYFDRDTRHILANENRLKKFKISTKKE